MEAGFRKADINSLPKVDFYMVQHFLSTNDKFRDANKRGKIQRSSNPDYLKTAIGRVQYKIENDVFTVKARVVPEHKVTKRQYSVVAVIDNQEEEIKDVFCESESDGCKAAAGGCKHAVAFLFYLYEKYSSPSPTDTTCLWKVPQLARVDENIDNFDLSLHNPSGIKRKNDVENGSGRFLETLLGKCPDSHTNTALKYHKSTSQSDACCMYNLMLEFKSQPLSTNDSKAFISFCKCSISVQACTSIEVNTRGQNSSLWHRLKFGRITASKLYELSRCLTPDGSLVNAVMGYSSQTTEAMERGLRLENKVVDIISKHYKNVRRCGLYLHPRYPAFGASPDAINENTVFEIKCPFKEENIKYYINKNGKLKDKVNCQIHLQMVMTQKENGVLVLVRPGFEKNRNPEKFVEFHEVNFDKDFITKAMKSSYKFWCEHIFIKLYGRF
ncbi:uncharacterized protein LOC110676787 [Aedes aegypti]|uniref:YqaJ viral recombinase domain-containing protein n=1 Tax=Aedes aegypti TaxID=7159 RepID=A0A6I8U958_AEDAE|nr:uncharacterized protein LOC110676787 [Aedes aegypti]